MFDINKTILDEDVLQRDPEGYLSELPEWSEMKALATARAEGITLSDEHWQVLHFLRDHYRDNGPTCTAREIIRALEDRFGDEHGKRHLYQLFPGGPVVQGCRIAGLPTPAYGIDPSFGSVH